MNIDRLLVCLLGLYLLYLLYKRHQPKLRRWWQHGKDRIPRSWNPRSPRDCVCCQAGIDLVRLPDPNFVVPWSHCKSNRGRKKSIDTTGYACPYPGCGYCGITDPNIHALVGFGWIDHVDTIRKLRCQACRKTFSNFAGLISDPNTISKFSKMRSQSVFPALHNRASAILLIFFEAILLCQLRLFLLRQSREVPLPTGTKINVPAP